MTERIHTWLLHYMPLIGYAVYGCAVGFEDDLFRYLIFAGGIVLVVYQTVLASIYIRPKSFILAISWMVLPIIVLVAYALIVDQFYWHYVFLEFTAVDLTAMLLALLIAFAAKAVREKGVGGGFLFPVLFTSILFGGVIFLFVLLFLEFFERTNFDYLNIVIICLAVLRSTFSFFWGVNGLAGGRGGHPEGMKKSDDDIAFKVILPSLGLWMIGVPLLVLLVRWLIAL